MRVTLFGAGYVGLVTGACFAEMGNDVVGIDIDADKVAALNAGQVSIYEPGLEAMVRANLDASRLRFSTDAAFGIEHAEIVIIAVGTPADDDGSADIGHVLAVARTIGRHMTRPTIVVDKSTVPVGTADRVRKTIVAALDERDLAIEFHVVSNPEFLKQGAAVADFMKPDRIVVGTDSEDALRVLDRLYAPFNRNHDKVLVMDARSAELTKYASNVMLATKISLMNEFANLAERLGADIEAVRRGIGSDARIGSHYIYPGCGYGGSCFPKDVRALTRIGESVGYDPSLVREVEAVNEQQKRRLFTKLHAYFDGDLEGKTIALWGLAFKPNTDDMREAPSRTFMEDVWRSGGRIRAYDPVAHDEARRLYAERDDLVVCERREATLDGADALAIVTEWNEFRSPDFDDLEARLTTPVIFDGRNLFDPDAMARMGFDYFGIGRGLGVQNDL